MPTITLPITTGLGCLLPFPFDFHFSWILSIITSKAQRKVIKKNSAATSHTSLCYLHGLPLELCTRYQSGAGIMALGGHILLFFFVFHFYHVFHFKSHSKHWASIQHFVSAEWCKYHLCSHSLLSETLKANNPIAYHTTHLRISKSSKQKPNQGENSEARSQWYLKQTYTSLLLSKVLAWDQADFYLALLPVSYLTSEKLLFLCLHFLIYKKYG